MQATQDVRSQPSDFARSLAIAALTAIAVTHFAELPDKIEEATYLTVMFLANIMASVALTGLLVARRMQRGAIEAGGALALVTLIGYVLSRSVGLPQIHDHIGHWLDPAGIAAALAEITMIGLALPHVAARPVRLGLFVVVPMMALVGISVAAGQAFEGHASGQEHAGDNDAPVVHAPVYAAAPALTRGDGAHAHLKADSTAQMHQGVVREYPDLRAASAHDRDTAQSLLRGVRRSARVLFPSYPAARRLSFVPYEGRHWRRPLAFHVRHLGYARDRRFLDPAHPESLVYWWPRRGRPILLAMMFRAPPGAPPRRAGSVPIWHGHGSQVGAMTHVWLTQDLRTAFANCLPAHALQEANPDFRYQPPRYFQAHSTLLCRTEP